MPRTALSRALPLAVATMLLLEAGMAHALQVTGIDVQNRNGQTFVTWNNLPGNGWTYHVYVSQYPLVTLSDFNINAWELGTVGDSSAVDRRASALLGSTLTFTIEEGSAPLSVRRGLFVRTPPQATWSHYLVLAESAIYPRDYKFLAGQNYTDVAVREQSRTPRPILQRHITDPPCDDYVLFANAFDAPGLPALWSTDNRALHFGVVPGQPGGALVLRGHGRGHSFLSGVHTTGHAGETVIAPDDYLDTWDVASFFFGYNSYYDPTLGHNPFATLGVVVDYVDRFVMHLMDWGQATFATDPQRTYALGTSMGGSFAFFLAWHHPDRVAAAMAVVPKTCMGYFGDTSPVLTSTFERMWSPLDVDLPTTIDGIPVYDYMDGRALAERYRRRGASPVFGVVGRRDDIVSWQEKPLLFAALESSRMGETWYWDGRTHITPSYDAALEPEQLDEQRLYRFRLDRSYPALSHCTADSDPGDGTLATGDSLGSINGHVTWDEQLLDESEQWECVLRPAAVRTQGGPIPAPEQFAVDVTPRRLQRFVVSDRASYAYTVTNASTGEFLQGGSVAVDSDYLLTIPAVPVVAGGSRVHVQVASLLGVGDAAAGGDLRLALGSNPVRGSALMSVNWASAGDARIDLFDLAGRRLRTLFAGPARGPAIIGLDARGLAPGVYLVRASQGTDHVSQRVVVVN